MKRTAFAIAVLLALASPAGAQSSPDWQRCSAIGGDADENIAACTRIIRAGNDTPVNISIAHQNRAYQTHRKKDYEGAIRDLDEAIRINPRNAQAWTNRGETYERLKNFDRAIADHTEAIRIDPIHKDAWYNRGHVYHTIGNNERAIADYKQALKINPKDDDARTNLRQLGVNE